MNTTTTTSEATVLEPSFSPKPARPSRLTVRLEDPATSPSPSPDPDPEESPTPS